jgi:hypothetical protein
MAEQYDPGYKEQGYQAYKEPQQDGSDGLFSYFTAIAPLQTTVVINNFKCQVCNTSFLSYNKRFTHMTAKGHLLLKSTVKKDPPYAITFDKSFDVLAGANLPEKVSTAPPFRVGSGIGYRGFSYLTVQVRLNKDGSL